MKNSNRVIIPGNGRFWLAPVDTLPPGQLLRVTGAPTSANVTATVNAVASTPVSVSGTTQDADMLELAQAIAALSTVGSGRVSVLPASETNPFAYLVFIDPAVTTQAITAAATFTGGTTPAIEVVTDTVGLGSWAAWTEIGHTSKDSPLQVNRSGGDTTVLDTWQESGVEASTAATQFALAYTLLQYDVASMKLYYGSNATFGANGMVQTSKQNPAATEHALLLQILNGNKAEWRHYPRVSTIAADGENFDTTKLAGMPIKSTLLSSPTYAFGQQLSQVGAAA